MIEYITSFIWGFGFGMLFIGMLIQKGKLPHYKFEKNIQKKEKRTDNFI